MVSDMFGDGAGDFDFDVNIKFKARGKGKGKGRGSADTYSDRRFSTEQNYRGSGRAHGRGDTRTQSGLGRYNTFYPYPYGHAYPAYPAYAPTYRPRRNTTRSPVTTYPSYPPLAPENKATKPAE
jgi:hypothetical protein